METIKVNGTNVEVGDFIFALGEMPSALVSRKAIRDFLPEVHETHGKNTVFHERIVSVHETRGQVKFIFAGLTSSVEEMRTGLLALLTEAATLKAERERTRSRRQHPANTDTGDGKRTGTGEKSPKLRVVKRPLFRR